MNNSKYLVVTVIVSFVFMFSSCKNEPDIELITACGVENPTEKLVWLAELISKAENDNSINYLGHIWIKKYDNKDYIVTDFMMGSGGIAYYCFNCDGEIDTVEDLSFYDSLTDDDVVYTNIP